MRVSSNIEFGHRTVNAQPTAHTPEPRTAALSRLTQPPRSTPLGTILTALTIAAAITPISPSATAQQITLHVDDDAPAGGDGLTWSTAFRDLQDALDIANQALTGTVEVRIAQGTYIPPERFPLARGFRIDPPSILSASVMHFTAGHGASSLPGLPVAVRADRDIPQLTSGVTIRLDGGYAGITGSKPDARDPAAFVSILSGDILGNDDGTTPSRSDNVKIILSALMSPQTRLDLDGLNVVSAGTKVGSGAAGVRADAPYSTPFALGVRNCVFRDIQTGAEGAGVWTRSVLSDVVGCTFEDMNLGNPLTSGSSTGALMLIGSATGSGRDTATIQDCVFRRCTGSSGAGLYAGYYSGPITVEFTRFEDNKAEGGAAVLSSNYDARLFARNTKFLRNTAKWAGAIYGGRIDARLCEFTGNIATHASFGGGAVWNSGSNTFADCVFSANRTAGVGGAVLGVGLFERCTFVDNAATFGGAVSVGDYWQTTFQSSRFTRNRAENFGGAIHAPEGCIVRDSIFDLNTADSSNSPYAWEAFGGAIHASNVLVQRSKFLGNVARSDRLHASGGAIHTTGALHATNSVFCGNAAIGHDSATGGALTIGTGGVLGFITVARNFAQSTAVPAEGGGIANGFGPCELHSSIIWQNSATGTPTQQAQIVSLIPFYTIWSRFNIVSGLPAAFDAVANSGADPLLMDIDGPDEIAGTIDDDLRIASIGSPCIDSAGPGFNTETEDVDRRPRSVVTPVNPPQPNFNTPEDRGASEYQGNVTCARFDSNLDGKVNSIDLAAFLARFGRTQIAGTWPDFNADGIINTKDLIRFLAVFGCSRWE